ncbi:xanthine dehydrogenase family protein molybdopterin-binding subunit [Roseomonas sp. CAU 1739]|uniref:xanthine dehydrogenase family protein molybdopterin-binding subunit n=1 Tax=Roseomonas sp. CAU 1739 TaxID=3140364 RepID=UPI00325B04F9
MNWVGRSLRRLEDPALLRGEGRFTADIAAGARAVRFLRSPIASGQITALHPPPEMPPGAVFVSAAEMADVGTIKPMLHRFAYRPVEQPVLPIDHVHFVGQPIAAIAADNAALAEDLVEAIVVEFEAATPVVDLASALRLDAPLVHAVAPGNVAVEGVLTSPECAAAFAAAPQVVEVAFRSHRQNATPMEARAGCAQYDRATGRVRLTASVQMPHMLRTGIAELLSMPEADLQVIAPDVGGGFGQKMALFPEYAVLVWLARRHRSDFAWIEDRNENLTASAHSRDQAHVLRGAFAEDGTLLGLDADILANVGAFSSYPVTCGVEPLMAFAEYPGPYKVPAYGARARGVLTHTCPMAPYRGVSRPVITFGIERLMDRAAARLGLEPAAIRRRNLVDSFPYRTVTGLTLDEASYVETLDDVVSLIDVPAFRTRQQMAREQGRYLGLGLAVLNERTGYGTPAFAARGMGIVPGYEVVDIDMTPSGEVELRIGASPHGQGLRTTLAQIVADRLGVTPDRVRVIHGDTDRTPYGWGTFASRSTVISGGASQRAADQLAARLRAAAAKVLQATAQEITLCNGEAVAANGSSIAIAALARQVHQRSDLFDGFNLAETASYDPDGTFSNACHAAIVEVDPETGHVRIERYLVVEDAGRIINPLIAEGQVRGGVAQGIANALFEQVVYAEDGNILTGTLADYALPTVAEIPPIEIHHRESLSVATLTGAKGLGEGGAIGAPAAIANAITDALTPFGAEITEIPATPARIRALIRNAKSPHTDGETA